MGNFGQYYSREAHKQGQFCDLNSIAHSFIEVQSSAKSTGFGWRGGLWLCIAVQGRCGQLSLSAKVGRHNFDKGWGEASWEKLGRKLHEVFSI